MEALISSSCLRMYSTLILETGTISPSSCKSHIAHVTGNLDMKCNGSMDFRYLRLIRTPQHVHQPSPQQTTSPVPQRIIELGVVIQNGNGTRHLFGE